MREHVELGSKTGAPRTHAGDPPHGESQGQSGTAGEELDYKAAANYPKSLHDFISMLEFALPAFQGFLDSSAYLSLSQPVLRIP